MHLRPLPTPARGYITLLSVIIVGFISLSIAVSLLLTGVSNAQTGVVHGQSITARGYANACAEEALQRIRNTTSFTGTGSLSIGVGSCTYTVVSQGSEARTIDATGTAGPVVRAVRVTVTAINPLITIGSWQEVPGLSSTPTCSGNLCKIDELYRIILEREADAAGRTYWDSLMAGGMVLSDVAWSFMNSAEFTAAHGNILTISDGAFVDLMYTTLLKRPADSGGRTFWLNALAAGTSRKNVFLGFFNSTEFHDKYPILFN